MFRYDIEMMKTSPHPPLSRLSRQLSQLIEKAEELIKIEQVVQTYFDPDLTQHCHVANLRNDCLIIAIDNAAWATQLRFMIPRLLEQLKIEPLLKKLKKIEYFILPDDTERKDRIEQPKNLSKENALLIDEIAKTISHEKLRKVLERLAENGELEKSKKK